MRGRVARSQTKRAAKMRVEEVIIRSPSGFS